MSEPSVIHDTPNLDDTRHYLNRELSHLKFNERVLAQAFDSALPLIERLKFLLIFSSNLDEFFEIRVAGLMQSIKFERESIGLDGKHPDEVLREISRICHDLVDKQYDLLNNVLMPAMEVEGIRFMRRNDWSDTQSEWVRAFVEREILPIVSPIGLDPAHPFPRLVNKSLNFIVEIEGKDAFGRDLKYAIVPAPRSLPRLVQFPEELDQSAYNFVFLSSMVHAHADELFPGMSVKGCYQFRITRNADLDVDMDGIADLARALRGELHSRRFGTAVRLEVAENCPQELIEYLLREVGLGENELYKVNGPVNLKRMFSVPSLIDRPELFFPPFTPKIPKGLSRKDNIFDAVSRKDFLLFHPYESFTPVVQLLSQAAKDPDVVAIKQTLYRTGDNSSVVKALIDAARNGKEVTVIVELRARFDEEENLELASRLQEAGAVVVYGVVGYKTHSKMILIVRREGKKIKRYVHLGTGNYHSGNARLYSDYSLLSAGAAIGEDVHRLFQQLTGMGKTEKMNLILHSPFTLRKQLIRMIDHEAKVQADGGEGHIILKCNGLTERKIILALYRAAQAGVKIDLIIRGMCCLRPGEPGVSENIRVFSVIGRFLEHSRCFYFANNEHRVYCASADLMERNLTRRIETCFPVEQTELANRIISELKLYIDDERAWLLRNTGEYSARDGDIATLVQSILLNKLST
ncbi:MAG: polyphosphate kinase [Flavobacteriales bacterium]|jgi:polyphosphate kinase